MKKGLSFAMAMLFVMAAVLTSLVPVAVRAFNEEDDNSPYSIAYMEELSDSGVKSGEGYVASKEVLNSLDNYYDWDLELANMLQETNSFEYDYSMICSTEKSDKIAVMYALMDVFETTKLEKLKESILDYFNRYAPYTEDDLLIAFYDQTSVTYTNHSDITVTKGLSAEDAMANFSHWRAGKWAYNNYNQYSTNFPYLAEMGGDCTNFVSQALYNGELKMHGIGTAIKRTENTSNPKLRLS